MFDLTGKRALITGASGGIGGAVAAALLGQGARVALSGRNIKALEAMCADLGEGAVSIPADLANPDEVAPLMTRTEEALGGLDILVNNAGMTRDNLAMRMKDEDWQAVLDLNLTASFRLAKAALRGMMKQRYGRIIGISSIVGVTGNAGQANYAASKAGMIGYSKSLAKEVASRGVTVNCIAPGYVATAMTADLGDVVQQSIQANVPAGRMGDPDEIAAAVVFLASDEASYVTGQTLHINGGMAMM